MMKSIAIVLATVIGLALSGHADAASRHHKHRTRNANRVGPYGSAVVGITNYPGDHSGDEQDLVDSITSQNATTRDVTSTTNDHPLGYSATFGYRFTRYLAMELSLSQYGKLVSRADADLDFGDGAGFQPATLKLSFLAGGPVISAVGILPLGEKVELFGRFGYLFASSERDISSSLNGQRAGFFSAKGDSQNQVYGVGLAWNINQVYSVRAEYQRISDVGDRNRTGTEDMNIMGIGVIVRF